MAFSTGGYELPKGDFSYSPKFTDPFAASREIELLPQDERDVEAISEALSKSGLTTQKIFNLFKDRYSDKTKSVKKFVLSMSFLLSLTLVAGVKITEINLFGVEVSPEMENVFLGAILFIHFLTFAYFIYLRGYDLDLYNAIIRRVKKGTESYLDFSNKLDQIVHKYELQSVEYLLDDFRENATVMNPQEEDIEAYRALKFYESELKKTHDGYNLIDRLEILAVWGLYITGLIAVILSFL